MIKILTQSRYTELVKASKEIEEKTINSKLEAAKKEYEQWEEDWRSEKAESDKLFNDKIDNLKKEIFNLKADQKIVLDRKELEVDVRIATATKELTQQVQELTITNANHKKEAEMLTQAFKNLGFDVKDMKEILNKLVDGVVSKNTVNVIRD